MAASPPATKATGSRSIAISPNGKLLAAIVRFRHIETSRRRRRLRGAAVHLVLRRDGRDIGELVTAGTPSRLEFLNDSTLLAGMTPVVIVDQPFPAIVEWDMTVLQLKPDRSIAFFKKKQPGLVLSHRRETHRMFVQYHSSSVHSSDLGLWKLDPLEELRQFTLSGNVCGGQLLPNDRIAIVKRNGNLVIMRAPPAAPASE